MEDECHYVKVIYQRGNNYKVTIPKQIVQKFKIEKGQYVKVCADGDKIIIVPGV